VAFLFVRFFLGPPPRPGREIPGWNSYALTADLEAPPLPIEIEAVVSQRFSSSSSSAVEKTHDRPGASKERKLAPSPSAYLI
jgi:hypothetical protein